jgi:hypothetical protein
VAKEFTDTQKQLAPAAKGYNTQVYQILLLETQEHRTMNFFPC